MKWTGKHQAGVYNGWCSSKSTGLFFKSSHPPSTSPSCPRAGGLISERIWCLCCFPPEVYLGLSTCLWLSDRIPYLRAQVSGRCMGIKSLAIVPPGCVTTDFNKGRRGGDGREMWVWVGAGWRGTSGSGSEQAEERKTTDNRGQVERVGEAEREHVPLYCLLRRKNVTLSLFFLSLPLFFPSFLPPSLYPVAVHWCTDGIFSPLSTMAMSLISPLLQWITVFQQTQQSSAPVPPP